MSEFTLVRGVLDDAFASYDFGDGVTVVDSDGWESVTSEPNNFLKIVYVTYEDDNANYDSHKLSFHVNLKDDLSVDEAYAFIVDSGSEIGSYNKKQKSPIKMK